MCVSCMHIYIYISCICLCMYHVIIFMYIRYDVYISIFIPWPPNGSPKIGRYNKQSIIVRYDLAFFLACLCYIDDCFG